MLDRCCNGDRCCDGDLGYLLLQIVAICVLLFLIGTTAVVEHPDWFGEASAVTQTLAGR
jgi:hypothetical protein